MIAGISAWGEVAKAAFGLVQTGIRTNEMMVASGSVIGRRLGTIAAAARNPFDGDYVEMGRMVPEKVSAFSEAGDALVKHWSALLLQTSSEVHQLSSLFLEGRPLSVGDVSALAARATTHATRVLTTSMNTGSVAIAPIHKRATANARRLRASR